jgi:NAD-dependent deacetylase
LAAEITSQADILVVVGTSLQVYPAAGLISYASPFIPKYIIDPSIPEVHGIGQFKPIEEGAGKGLSILKNQLT